METPERNGHRNERMDRLEHLMELLITDHLTFTDEHKRLLTAQVVLTEIVQKLGQTTEELAQQMKEQSAAADERMRELDERLNTLIITVDGLIRNRPNP
jgi:phosphopantetheine adenylyltransferase